MGGGFYRSANGWRVRCPVHGGQDRNLLIKAGSSADIVRQTFGTTANNAVAATVAVVISFLFWGIGIGQLYRDVYMRAWRVET